MISLTRRRPASQHSLERAGGKPHCRVYRGSCSLFQL